MIAITKRLTQITMIVATLSAIATVQPLRADTVGLVQQCAAVAALGFAVLPVGSGG